MKTFTVIVGCILVVALMATQATAAPLSVLPDHSFEYEVPWEEYWEPDVEVPGYVRKKRQWKVEGTYVDGPGGDNYRVSGGYSNTFDNGRGSIDIGGYKTNGDAGGFIDLGYKF